jgi:hypothetical protein
MASEYLRAAPLSSGLDEMTALGASKLVGEICSGMS